MFISKMFLKYIVLIVFANLCNGYNLLVVFPVITKSHVILGHAIVRNLLNAGHEVTYITPIPPKFQSTKLRIVDVSSNFKMTIPGQYMNIETLVQERSFTQDTLTKVHNFFLSFANMTIFHDDVQRLIQDPNEHYDAVLVEWMFSELYCGFASLFNCPYIWVTSIEPMNSFMSFIGGFLNPNYVRLSHVGKYEMPFTFWQRVEELYYTVWYYFMKRSMLDIENKIYNKGFAAGVAMRERVLPPYDEVRYNASLALANTYISSSSSQTLPQTYKYIGGIHIDEVVKPLPEDIQHIMDTAENGVIYFSLGSVFRSVDMSDDMKRRILEVFSGLKQTIIWKYEGSLPKLPKNVHIFEWTPQQSILAHKNCRLFITHGGQLSSIEAIHFRVPLIGTPACADQFFNINRAVSKGYARRVYISSDMPERLNETINDVLHNPRYKEKAMEHSAIYEHRLATPGQELVFWVEHVIVTRGASYLRSASLNVPLYQILYLDFIAIVLCVVFILKKIIFSLCFSNKCENMKNKND